MQDFLSVNPFNAEDTHFIQRTRTQSFWKPCKPCRVGVDLIALVEYSKMSTHMAANQSFIRIFALFSIGQISPEQRKD